MRRFTHQTLEEPRQSAEQPGATHVRLESGREEVKAALARKVALRSFVLGNSLATHPMEGCDATPDGRPDELTWRRYERFAAGGAKLIWFEATAICQEGRANPRQAWIGKNTVSDFARLHDRMLAVHLERWGAAGDLLIPLQLTHSGRYSHPRRIIAYHNPLIDQKTATPLDYPVITDDELERLEDQYVEAAGLALEAGFRAIDLKVTHGYLLSELMGAKTREGRYGGSLENRARFMRNVLGKIRASFGGRLIPCMRLGCFDSLPYERDPETGVGRPLACPVFPTRAISAPTRTILCARTWAR
ncbi:MAG: hypothetical protein NT090_27225 [Acidobacteria bacterium]|nr:hypothetical protein [Acidobacteriota bacterium]